MSQNAVQAYESPVGDLEWVFITGEGKEDLQGVMKYQADVVLSAEVGEQVKESVMSFWEENKPRGAKQPKSIGLYPHTVKDEEASKAEGENIYKKTGKVVIRFKTGTEYVSGDQKIIKTFNSKGNEVSLHGKKIGNGSRGRCIGSIAIYNIGKATQGVTFYLDAVQLSKFVEFVGSATPSGAIDEEDGDFEGVEGSPTPLEDEEAPAKPRL